MSDQRAVKRSTCDPFIVIRRYGPHGYYPRYRFADPEALYLGDRDEAYSAVVVGDAEFAGRISLTSELAWIFPQEIRLIGAMALSQHPDFGKLIFYLHEEYETIPLDPEGDLTQPRIQHAVSEAVVRQRLTYPLDPIDLRDDFNPLDFQHLYEGLRVSDPTLLRGVSALLKSSMLSCHSLFGEEAALLCFISLEAALEVVRTRLRTQRGLATVSFADAFNYIDQVATYPLGEYFESCHQLRALVVHPKPARAEASWTPILQADHYYDTYEAVVRLYRHLILGEDLAVESSA